MSFKSAVARTARRLLTPSDPSATTTNMTPTMASEKSTPSSSAESRYHLAGPGRVDFGRLGFPEYSDCYALVVDDLFTPAELCRFLSKAESSAPWAVAQVNVTEHIAYTRPDYRNGQRIIYDDRELSDEIFARLRPHLGEIEEIEEETWSRAGGAKVLKRKMVCMNERLRFLRYEKGGFFRAHCDGWYMRPDCSQRTYMTVQLYLPSTTDPATASMEPAKGGATRFLSRRTDHYVDVEPVPGRVLVFQHEKLLHAGEEVEDGVKVTMRSDILYTQ